MTGDIQILEEQLPATETIFGWTVQGKTKLATMLMKESTVMVLHVEVNKSVIETELRHFWDIETISIKGTEQNAKKEESVMEYFSKKCEEKRYSVQLPWKDTMELDENKGVTMTRLKQFTRRLRKDQSVLRCYDNAIRKYLTSGVAEVTEEQRAPMTHCYYMLNQAVIKGDHQTTKIRNSI